MWVKMNWFKNPPDYILINLRYIQRIYVQKSEYEEEYEVRGMLDDTWEHPHEVLALCGSKEEAIEKMNKITQCLKRNVQLAF